MSIRRLWIATTIVGMFACGGIAVVDNSSVSSGGGGASAGTSAGGSGKTHCQYVCTNLYNCAHGNGGMCPGLIGVSQEAFLNTHNSGCLYNCEKNPDDQAMQEPIPADLNACIQALYTFFTTSPVVWEACSG